MPARSSHTRRSYPGDWHVRYTDLVHKHLLPPYRFFAAMIVRPSFEGEYSIVLHGTKEDYDLDWDKTAKVFVSHLDRREEHLVFDAREQLGERTERDKDRHQNH